MKRLSSLLFLLSLNAHAVDVTVDELWGATSGLWDGRYLAVCVEPGAPSAEGRRRYVIDSASSRMLTEKELRALALISDLPRKDRQELALAVLNSPETDLPPWARVAKYPTRATVYRSLQGQDILVVSIPPAPLEPPIRYGGFAHNDVAPTNSVPTPSTLWLLSLGVILLGALRYGRR